MSMSLKMKSKSYQEQLPNLYELFSIKSNDAVDYIQSLKNVVSSKEITTFLRFELNKILETCKVSDAPFERVGLPIELYQDKYKLVTLHLTKSKQIESSRENNSELISNTVNDSIVGFIGGGTNYVSEYIFESESINTFSPEVRMNLNKVYKVGAGDVLEINSGFLVHDIPASSSLLMLSVDMMFTDCELMWLFNKKTGLSIKCASATTLGTRLQYMVKLFLMFPSEENIKAIKKLAKSCNYHFVRWDAIKALLQLDYKTGVKFLNDATIDEHPHICVAAKKTLENISKKGISTVR